MTPLSLLYKHAAIPLAFNKCAGSSPQHASPSPSIWHVLFRTCSSIPHKPAPESVVAYEVWTYVPPYQPTPPPPPPPTGRMGTDPNPMATGHKNPNGHIVMSVLQRLENITEAPQLPASYPAMMILAAMPPLFFRAMNHRAVSWMGSSQKSRTD